MKALQLSKFYPPVFGGIESVVYELTEGLNAIGIPTDVLCANTARGTVREQASVGYSVTRTSSWGKKLSTSLSPAMLTEFRRAASRYDVIHVHLPDPLTNLALWMAKPKSKIVVHWHSDIIHQQHALKLYAPLQHWLLDRADAIIATSEAYARSSPWLQPFMAKVHVIPIGIRPPPTAAPAAVAEIRQRHEGRRIIFSVGRMTYYKGFDVLLEAVAHLPEDAVVVIAGGGELLEAHRERVDRERLSRRIQFIGRVDSKVLSAYYGAADLYCLPSTVRAEAFGVVLLEAMAAGLPVVATSIEGSGVPWVVADGVTGLLVPVRDPTALAQAISALLASPEQAAAYGRAGRQRFIELFTAQRMVDLTAELYGSLTRIRKTGSHSSTELSVQSGTTPGVMLDKAARSVNGAA